MKKQEDMIMTEKKQIEITDSPIDPGYLMVGVYVLFVTALVLLGWFGAAGANGETNSVPGETANIIHHINAAVQQ
jgi:hypothetical protein